MRIGLRIAGVIALTAMGFIATAQPTKSNDKKPKTGLTASKTDTTRGKQEPIQQQDNGELKKPKQFEERKLGSEKMADKKFTVPRHFFQNMYTHYNFYFNAKYKMLDIIEQAKLAYKEDYTRLLPFYNYSLNTTAQNTEIDSILQKCTAGILLHDLRNDWVDNLYLLIGRAYLLRKDYDSASMTFQYINYTYSPKEKDGYDKVIGSNSNEGGSALSIATKEKSNIYKKVIELPPSRNESFLWQIRTYTEKEEFIDAASLITTLRNDPAFPKRLQEEIAEVEAYNYYKQGILDSSAKYLTTAIKLADDKTEKARWYYLIGQMQQATGHLDESSEYYAKCANTTQDPVMEVYARLASVRLRKNADPKMVQQNIDEVLKMARREKYELYRDIVYYAAALMEIERNGYEKAEEYFKKSIRFNADNPTQRSSSFLALADMSFDQKKYGKAGNYYDSVNISDVDSLLVKRIEERKPGCKTVYEKDRIIFAQDSLLSIAAMPETERNSYVRALAKRLRKERGLKDAIDSSSTGLALNATQLGKGPDIIFNGEKGDFYFYNASQKSNGFQAFKQKWGARPNVDNWRRSTAIQIGFANAAGAKADTDKTDEPPKTAGGAVDINAVYNPTEFTFDALSTNLPIEKESKDASNQAINEAMLDKARALQNQIEDLPEAIKVYEALLVRLGKDTAAQEVIFNLVYCYSKTGNTAKADELKRKLNSDYKDGPFAKKINLPAQGNEKGNPAATAVYKQIYNLFIEGNFDEAVAEKRKADSTFGTNFWTPQLLYIEAVYYIKQREDSVAISRLNSIVSGFATTPLATKATALIDVLSRRKEIEAHLTSLNIVRATDSTAGTPVYNAPPPATTRTVTTTIKDTAATGLVTKPIITPPLITPKKDTIQRTLPPPNTPFVIDTNAAQMVIIVLDKVDVVYLNESLNAFSRYNSQNLRTQKFEYNKIKLNPTYSLVTINSADFVNGTKAMEYLDKVKPKAAAAIVPWLEAAKYSLIMISQSNLDLLKVNFDVQAYIKTLKAAMPGRF